LNPVTSSGRPSIDIGASANLKLGLVDKFFYMGDMLSVDGDADAAVEATKQTRWNKFRQLLPLLTNKDISLIIEEECTAVVCELVCCIEVRQARKTKKRGDTSAATKKRMIRWMCDAKVKR